MRRALAFVAALAALCAGPALAQTPTYSPGQTGAVGTIVTAKDPNGNSRQVVIPSVQIYNPSGGGGGGVSGQGIPTQNAPQTGQSLNGTIGTTSAFITTSGMFVGWVTIQNTSTSGTIHIALGRAATASDVTIGPGGALTLPFGPASGIQALGSAAGVTYAIIGY